MKFYIAFQCQNITKRYSENRENAYLAMKTCQLPGPTLGPQTPGQLMLASLVRLHFAMLAIYAKRNLGPPLNQILDLLGIHPFNK